METGKQPSCEEREDNHCKQSVTISNKRWFILFAFIYYASMNSAQMTEYASITNICVKYYNVDALTVNWTSIIYMALYPILVVPASYIIEAKGLRTAALIGCLGTALGTMIKLFSTATNNFWVVLLGQTITASAQLFTMCLPPKIAAVWFKSSEVSLACSLGTLGPNLGNALGYILTVSIVTDTDDMTLVGERLYILCWTLFALMVPVTLIVVFFFSNSPSIPPNNLLQSKMIEAEKSRQRGGKLALMLALFRKSGFIAHSIAYAINIAVFSAIMILLSEYVLEVFEDASEDAGRMGFLMMIFGFLGTTIFGVALDKTHKYKAMNVFIYIMSAISIGAMVVALYFKTLLGMYIACCIFGIFINAYIPAGFELGIELTYPSDESTTAGVLFAFSQLLGVAVAVSAGYINAYFGYFWSISALLLMLVMGSFVQMFVPNILHRQKAFKKHGTLSVILQEECDQD